MNYALTSHPSLALADCLVLGIYADEPSLAVQLDTECSGLIAKLSARLKEPGDSLWQHEVQGKAVFIIQLGEKKRFTIKKLLKRLHEVVDALIQQKMASALLCFPVLDKQNADWQLEQMILKIDNQQYQFLDFKKKTIKKNALESITFYLPGAKEQTLKTAAAIASGVQFTRDLGNTPANVCTPTYLGEQAKALAAQFKSISCTVLNQEDMQQMGMNTLLAVAKGSLEPPKLIEMHYQGAGKSEVIALVGKGITFDSGGLSIKLANVMDEMKYDMLGAASVLGTIKACALLNLPVNVVGIIPCAENLPSGSAVKPGDVVTSLSMQTVEIINTDAEGRLILADALTYAERFNPQFVIDIATLTGAIIIALGTLYTGLMANDDELAKLIEEAALKSLDPVWRLPLDEEYQEAIKSPIADMLNATFDRSAGSITGACFLSRFTEKYRWAHLDIAGTAWVSGKLRNATGRPVYLLTQLLRHVAHSR